MKIRSAHAGIVLALSLLAIAGCREERPTAPATITSIEPAETGPETSCKVDTECWCRSFTGAEFIPGKVQSRCEKSKCVACLYE